MRNRIEGYISLTAFKYGRAPKAYMRFNGVHVTIERGESGFYATSPDIQGLLVVGDTPEQIIDELPKAIAEMREAASETPKPSGFYNSLTPEQQKAALSYDGPDGFGPSDGPKVKEG